MGKNVCFFTSPTAYTDTVQSAYHVERCIQISLSKTNLIIVINLIYKLKFLQITMRLAWHSSVPWKKFKISKGDGEMFS